MSKSFTRAFLVLGILVAIAGLSYWAQDWGHGRGVDAAELEYQHDIGLLLCEDALTRRLETERGLSQILSFSSNIKLPIYSFADKSDDIGIYSVLFDEAQRLRVNLREREYDISLFCRAPILGGSTEEAIAAGRLKELQGNRLPTGRERQEQRLLECLLRGEGDC